MAFFRKKKKQVESNKPWYREWSEALIIAVVLALIIRTFVFQAFKIPSGSMLDTLLIGDHLLVNKFIYGTKLPFSNKRHLALRSPERGDVIVFEFPEDEGKSYFQRRDFIKRLIGLPGDVVEIRAKQVFVNGELLQFEQEIYRDSQVLPAAVGPRDYMAPFKVPENQYFVLGDNRDFSFDGRFWGFVDNSKVKGLAFIKYWSWDAEASLPGKIRFNRIGRPIH
ncbi:signal peptidase I [Pelobacter sp. M08fum]|uniref:Signal peptidase I n=2 Tax=Pelovirga terrestris TaxID=2771352 RepID=A0A8J6UG86_9BACT|nr:signal peptidase I [Pelovirga terrestris]MBD1399268.1 signal peptidase I [Pelovirga terrestris]